MAIMELKWPLIVFIIAVLAESVRGQGMFVNRSSQLPPLVLQLNYGVAVTNVGDGQGPMEWVVAGHSGTNIVLQLNEATGQYTNIAQEGTPYENLMDAGGKAIGVSACDLDGDGLEEIYFLNINGYAGPKDVTMKDRLFKWRNGSYEDLFQDDANLEVSNMFNGRSVACVDRTGSGKYGFLLAAYARDNQGKFGLIEMDESDPRNDASNGHIVLHNTAVAAGIDFTTGGRGIAVGPILGEDGLSDIYFVNEGNGMMGNRGDNALFENDGQGHFTNVAASLNLADYQPGRGVTLTDFNNDGKTDIVYGNWMGPHKLQIQGVDANGNPTFNNAAETSNSDFDDASPIRTVIAADFDNSGHLQVFMNNIYYRGINTRNRLYRILPRGPTVVIAAESIGDAEETDGYGTGAAVSDIDGDGVLELLISHGESRAQPLTYYHVSNSLAAGNNWLRVLPLTQYGAPARGSKVTITLEDGTQLSRISDGGSGYLCEMEPVTHFGLGESTARQLKVIWPDGHVITKSLTPNDINKMHKISFTGELTTVQGISMGQQGNRNSVSYQSTPTGNQATSDGESSDRRTYGQRRTRVQVGYSTSSGETGTRANGSTSQSNRNWRRTSTASESSLEASPRRRITQTRASGVNTGYSQYGQYYGQSATSNAGQTSGYANTRYSQSARAQTAGRRRTTSGSRRRQGNRRRYSYRRRQSTSNQSGGSYNYRSQPRQSSYNAPRRNSAYHRIASNQQNSRTRVTSVNSRQPTYSSSTRYRSSVSQGNPTYARTQHQGQVYRSPSSQGQDGRYSSSTRSTSFRGTRRGQVRTRQRAAPVWRGYSSSSQGQTGVQVRRYSRYSRRTPTANN